MIGCFFVNFVCIELIAVHTFSVRLGRFTVGCAASAGRLPRAPTLAPRPVTPNYGHCVCVNTALYYKNNDCS